MNSLTVLNFFFIFGPFFIKNFLSSSVKHVPNPFYEIPNIKCEKINYADFEALIHQKQVHNFFNQKTKVPFDDLKNNSNLSELIFHFLKKKNKSNRTKTNLSISMLFSGSEVVKPDAKLEKFDEFMKFIEKTLLEEPKRFLYVHVRFSKRNHATYKYSIEKLPPTPQPPTSSSSVVNKPPTSNQESTDFLSILKFCALFLLAVVFIFVLFFAIFKIFDDSVEL